MKAKLPTIVTLVTQLSDQDITSTLHGESADSANRVRDRNLNEQKWYKNKNNQIEWNHRLKCRPKEQNLGFVVFIHQTMANAINSITFSKAFIILIRDWMRMKTTNARVNVKYRKLFICDISQTTGTTETTDATQTPFHIRNWFTSLSSLCAVPCLPMHFTLVSLFRGKLFLCSLFLWECVTTIVWILTPKRLTLSWNGFNGKILKILFRNNRFATFSRDY